MNELAESASESDVSESEDEFMVPKSRSVPNLEGLLICTVSLILKSSRDSETTGNAIDISEPKREFLISPSLSMTHHGKHI